MPLGHDKARRAALVQMPRMVQTHPGREGIAGVGLFRIRRPKDIVLVDGDELIRSAKFASFNPQILGLGDIGAKSEPVEAIATMVDLGGFTVFCSQIDPDLAVPEYLSRFLDWFFSSLRRELVRDERPAGFETWCDPPFFTKFMGDGVMLLWNVAGNTPQEINNIVVVMREICRRYPRFHKEVSRDVAAAPPLLRCGIARGRVLSVGNGSDFVGPCINIAARLQKFSLLTFCVARRGFNFKDDMATDAAEDFEVKRVEIRGIASRELVYVLKSEFAALPPEEQSLFEAV